MLLAQSLYIIVMRMIACATVQENAMHGLRKAFCVYRAEKGASTHQLAAMAGHLSLSEVQRYTRAVDRERMIKALVIKA